MKTQEELNAIKEEVETMNNKLAALTEKVLAQVSGGAVWSTEPIADCHVICNNPECEHYGHYVSAAVGPTAPGGGNYCVCDFCGELITTPYGNPIIIG